MGLSGRVAGGPRSRAAPSRIRVDQLLVDRGLAASRTEAARLVMAGLVRVGGVPVGKAGQPVRGAVVVTVARPSPFVGRGGEKLAGALDAFGIRVAGRVGLDVGASTGGFVDCLLQRGALRVHAVDVGRGQLHARLRSDPRVRLHEGLNAKRLAPDLLGEVASVATVDVSFISLTKILPAVASCLAADGAMVALVKPQFEVGRGQVGKGGVVRDARLQREAVLSVLAAARAVGLEPAGVVASSPRGVKGNREFFVHLTSRPGLSADMVDLQVARAVGGDS